MAALFRIVTNLSSRDVVGLSNIRRFLSIGKCIQHTARKSVKADWLTESMSVVEHGLRRFEVLRSSNVPGWTGLVLVFIPIDLSILRGVVATPPANPNNVWSVAIAVSR